jgi:hypothetical protein
MKKSRKPTPGASAAQLRSAGTHPFGSLAGYVPLGGSQQHLYRTMREAVPILDAAVVKLVRLVGGFSVSCTDARAQRRLENFLRTVPCGRGQQGIDAFLSGYLSNLLTDGCAIGEMVVSGGQLCAVCWGDTTQIEIQEGASPLEFVICGRDEHGQMRPLPYQHLLLFTPLDPEPANPYGVSLFRSMPFVTDVLLKVYHTVGINWERAGNVRYAVVYHPGSDPVDRACADDRSRMLAEEWSRAMQESKNGAVRDFVAVGDVDIRVIGSDGQILDSQVPVRQMLEQLVARTGLPPFLLGLSWSSTERMSTQQADLLTSELWALRRTVQPTLERICDMFLRLAGFGCGAEIVWDDISLQDIVDEAKAELYRAQAAQLQK